MDIPPPPDGFVMDAPPAAPSQIPPPPPGFEMQGAGSPAAPPAQPVVATTPEMAARQQMQQENAQRGTATSFGASVLGNFQGIAGEFQNALAKPVSMISPDAGENMRIAAARSLAYAGSPEHPIANVAGGVVGGLPGAFAGPAGAALSAVNAGAQTYGNVEAENATKAPADQVGGLAEASDVVLQTGLNYAMNRLGQKNLTGAIPGQVVQKLLPELAGKFGPAAARTIAATLIEGGVGAGTQFASNVITKYAGPGGKGVNPNQSLTEGVGTAAATGAAMGGVGRGIHEAVEAHATSARGPVPAPPPGFEVVPQQEAIAAPKAETAPEVPKAQGEPVPAHAGAEDRERIFPPGMSEGEKRAQSAVEDQITAEGQQGPPLTRGEQKIMDSVARQDTADTILAQQKEFLAARNANDPKADHMAATIQQGLSDYEQAHGEDAAEHLIEQVHAVTPEAAKAPPIESAKPAETFKLPEHTVEAPTKLQNMMETARQHRMKGAMAFPSKEDIAGKGSVYKEEIKPHLESAIGVVKELTSGLRKHFPMEAGAGDKNTAQIAREEFNRGKNENLSLLEKLKPAQTAFDKMKPEDRLDFQRHMYNGDHQPTPELQAIAKEGYAQALARKQAIVKMGVGHAQAWEDQHYNMLWKKDPTLAERMMQVNGPGAIEGKKGFLKKRTDTDFDAKLKQGLVPVYDNPVDMMVATDAEARKFMAGHNTMDRLVKQASIRRYDDPKQVPIGWTEAPQGTKGILKDLLPGDSKAYVPESVAAVLRNITTPSAFAGSKAFEAVRTINNVLTQAKLAISGFHVRKVAQETIGLELGRAYDLAMNGEYVKAAKAAIGSPLAPIRSIRKGINVQDMMLGKQAPSSPEEARIIDSMKTTFTAKSDPAFETAIRRNMSKAIADGGIQGMLRAGVRVPFAANEKLMQDGVFSLAQHAKLARGSDQVADFLRQHPNASDAELHKETAKISDHLDNVLGLMNRDNLFWSKTARDAATVSMLSVGWNYGSGRALAGGIVDLGKGLGSLAKGQKINNIDTRRISYVATTGVLTAMAGAITQYLATGKGPESLKDLVYPKTGAKDREGHDVRVNTGFYTSDWYDFLHDPIGTFGNKASPLVHAATDLSRNKEFDGTEVWDKNGTWKDLAVGIGKYLAKAGVPLSIEQIERLKEEGTKSPGLSALSMVGFKTARASLSESDAELLAHNLMSRGGSRTPEEAAKSTLLRKYTNEVRDKKPEANEDIRKAVASHELSPANVHEIQKRSKEGGGLKGPITSPELHPDDLMKVWDKMTPEEKSQYQWQVRGRIGRSDKTGPEKQAMFQKVQEGMRTK